MARGNIIFWIIVRKIFVLVSSLVYILIEKSLINYGTFVNLYSRYHGNRLQLKEVLACEQGNISGEFKTKIVDYSKELFKGTEKS